MATLEGVTPRPAAARRVSVSGLRRAAVVAHRYIGLTMAMFLMLVGSTGAVLAFREELEVALSPELFSVQAPTPGATPLDPVALRDALDARYPDARVPYVPLRHEPGRSLLFFLEAGEGAELLDDEVFVDPYTGGILGSRRWGDLTQGLENLVPFVYRLHFSLGLGDVGDAVLGVVALLWTLDCFVGAYLTFPPPRRAPSAPGRTWLARWATSWRLRVTRLPALIFTWHRASGLWVWAMLLVFAWSSVGLNLRAVYNPVMASVFSMEDLKATIPTLDTPRPDPALTWQEARRVGRALVAAESADRGFEVLEERWMSYDETTGAFRFVVRSSLDISERYPSTSVWFDGDDGDPIAFEAPTGQATGNTITAWLLHLHWGSVAFGGTAYRVFVSLVGLAVVLLSATGVWLWGKRLLRARLSRQA